MTNEHLAEIRERWMVHRTERGTIVGGYMDKEEFPMHALFDIHALLTELDRLTKLLLDAGRCLSCSAITIVREHNIRECSECKQVTDLRNYGYE